MIRIGAFLATGLFCTITAFPQTARQAVKWPLESIRIEGNRIYSDAQLLAVTGLKIGEPADKSTFDVARDRLLNTGVLETVVYRYRPTAARDGYEVTFQVAEIQQIYPIRFYNIKAPKTELLAWFKQKDPLFSGRISATDRIIGDYADYIEKFLSKRGIQEEIVGEMTSDRPGQLYILFHPKGPLPVVAEVKFTGNKVVPDYVLQKAIRGVAIGSRYTEWRFRELLRTSIRPIYEARGRVRVKFPTIETEPAPGDANGQRVIVHIEEGATYNLGHIEVDGAPGMQQRLLTVANLKTGDIANMGKVVTAMENIRAAMRKQGYLKAECHGERRVWEKRKVVDVFLKVTPGKRFVFGKLFLTGLDLAGEQEIRRIWGMKPGDIFNDSYPKYFLQRVREDGVFDNLKKTLARQEIHQDSGTVDVTLVFNPKKNKMRFGEKTPPAAGGSHRQPRDN